LTSELGAKGFRIPNQVVHERDPASGHMPGDLVGRRPLEALQQIVRWDSSATRRKRTNTLSMPSPAEPLRTTLLIMTLAMLTLR
jgi:hypothetical protein